MGPPPAITLEGFEVVQAIQDPANSVALLAGKTTIVRVALGTSGPGSITLRGTLRITDPSNPALDESVPALSTVLLDPAQNGQLGTKRTDLKYTLNFAWPASLLLAGYWSLSLESLLDDADGSPIPVPSGASTSVDLIDAAPLRIHVVGIRYQDSATPPMTYEPAAADFELLRSWLGRAYPVAQVLWSSAVIDFPKTWPFNASQVNAYLASLRALDVASGTDHRTHYYGLVADGGNGKNFMRGLASAIPSVADPSAVASGPAGIPYGSFRWDTDASYADWYGAHELGHTLGRTHANFCGAAGGGPYPFANGQLANNMIEGVGLDSGDPAQGISLRALPGTTWHDVMTYCDNQWLSSFTYEGIRTRLLDEDALAPGPSAPPASTSPSPGTGPMPTPQSIHIVATVNLTQNSAELQLLTPFATPAVTPLKEYLDRGHQERLLLQIQDDANRVLWTEVAPFRPNLCTAPDEDETGLVDAFIPRPDNAAKVLLLRGDQPLATFTCGLAPGPVQRIHSVTAAAGPGPAPRAGAAAPAATTRNPTIAWEDPVRTTALRMGPSPQQLPTYIVQLSTDNRHTWRTIGVGLDRPEVTIDRNLIRNAPEVVIRITATDGFHSSAQEQTFRPDEL
jgi:hypothetical protein